MKRRSRFVAWRVVCVGVCLALLTACDRGVPASGDPIVFVGIPPIAGLVERIGGEHLTVDVLIRAGQSPHWFEPSARQFARLADARAFVTARLPFEDRLLKSVVADRPDLRVIDARTEIELLATEGATDPHFWLDPQRLKIAARTIATSLAEIDPPHAESFASHLQALLSELDDLDAHVARKLQPFQGRTVLVYHPSLGYFVERYGLTQVAVEREGKAPSARGLAELVAWAKATDARILLHDPQVPSQSAEAIAREMGVRLVTFDPLARDIAGQIMHIASEIELALGVEP